MRTLNATTMLTNTDLDVDNLSLLSLDKAKLFVRNLSFEIISSTENSEKARIEVSITNIDMKILFKEYSQYSSKLIEEETNGIIIREKLNNKLTELLSRHNLKMRTFEVSINLHKEKKQWKLDVNENLVNAALGGLLEFAK